MSDYNLETFTQETFDAFIEAIDIKKVPLLSKDELRREITEFLNEYSKKSSFVLRHHEHKEVVEEILDNMTGLGPLEKLINDKTITDILVNGPKDIYIEKNGKLEKADVHFRDDQHTLQICQRIINFMSGRRIDQSSPIADARLPDGSRVNLIIPPVSLVGPCISIRKFSETFITLDQMVTTKNLSTQISRFFRLISKCRQNIIISGGTGSGKTTLMNALSAFINEEERIVTIEDAAELKVSRPHVVSLESRPPNLEGEGEITIRELVRNSLRMRPDRILVGECRGKEAFDMMQAMNTGHDGSMSTLHANSPIEAIDRLQNMIIMANLGLPSEAIRGFIADAVDIIIQISRMRDGVRRVVSIYEIGHDSEKNSVLTNELFKFKINGEDPKGRLTGEFVHVNVPKFIANKIIAAGHEKELKDIFSMGEK